MAKSEKEKKVNLAEELNKAVSLLQKSGVECQIINDCRCFVVPREWFLMIYEFAKDSEYIGPGSTRAINLTMSGYDNFNLGLTTADQNEYFVCTKAEPILDRIWGSNFKESK